MQFWAKTTFSNEPGISVYDHMVIVGCVARCIAESSPTLLERFNVQAAEIGMLASLHDLGKISPGFQRKCDVWLEENNLTDIASRCFWQRDYEPDHGKVSHSAIQDFLQHQGISRNIAIYLAAILGAHHGRLKFLPNPRGIRPPLNIKLTTDSQSGIDWSIERQVCAKRVWDYFASSGSMVSFSEDSAAIWWLAGLTTIADWIGSDENYFSPEPGTVEEDVPSIARHALDSIGFTLPVYFRKNNFFVNFEGAGALLNKYRPGNGIGHYGYRFYNIVNGLGFFNWVVFYLIKEQTGFKLDEIGFVFLEVLV